MSLKQNGDIESKSPSDNQDNNDDSVANGSLKDNDASTCAQNDDVDDDVTQHESRVPDGGWGWFIVLGVFMLRTITGETTTF